MSQYRVQNNTRSEEFLCNYLCNVPQEMTNGMMCSSNMNGYKTVVSMLGLIFLMQVWCV